MHCNYYFLKQISETLNKKLATYYVASSFSQDKDELIVELNSGKSSFFIRAHLRAQFSCLSFPSSFKRARKNSIDLFPEIILKKILGVKQFNNERSLAIELESGYNLIFKMHGNRSNVLLSKDDGVVQLFKRDLEEDLTIIPTQLNREIDWSKTFFMANRDDLQSKYFTWGKEVWRYLMSKGYDGLDADQQWSMVRSTTNQLENPTYHIVVKDQKPIFTLLPSEKSLSTFIDPIEAINEFFTLFVSKHALIAEKTVAVNSLNKLIKSSIGFIEKNSNKLNQIKSDFHYKLWADTIMSHLHDVKPGLKQVTLENLSDRNAPISIPLKPEIGPQKNAEIYYRKAKNQNIEIQKLEEAISRKQQEVANNKHLIEEISETQDLNSLRKLLSTGVKATKPKESEKLPFRKVEYEGYQIWIGKNATSNDELTLKYSHKDDLWLHAKDVAGSHVLIKFQAGKKFPGPVVERAAQLAAYHSKRKNETLCPVAHTLKKYVRKRKGDPPGVVVVERETVILVEPVQ